MPTAPGIGALRSWLATWNWWRIGVIVLSAASWFAILAFIRALFERRWT